MLHVPRQRLGARRQHRRGALEDLHHRRTQAARQEQGRRAAVGTGRCGIWSSPTIDPKRGMVYVATGNNYADPAQKTSDAVIALDMKSGTIKWVNQTTPNDNWTLGCRPREPGQSELPGEDGPDSRLLRLAEPGHGQRPRSARAAAEVGHGLRARPGQGRRARLAVPHRPGQRPRRPVGRRR